VGEVAAAQQVELLCSAPVIADERTWREVRSGASQGWMSTHYLVIDQRELVAPPQAEVPSFTYTQEAGEQLVTPNSGAIVLARRFSPSHALVIWRPAAAQAGLASESIYLLNLEAQTARRIQEDPTQLIFPPQYDGPRRINPRMAEDQIVVVDEQTGTEHVVYDRDPSVEQWLSDELRPTQTRDLYELFGLQWADSTHLVVTINDLSTDPQIQRGLSFGTVVRIDTTSGDVELLTKSGSVFDVLPDGTLLVRHGWIDGEIWQHPIDGGPALLSAAGPWVHGATGVSPDGRWVVWREFTAPSEGDWSERLPHECCSGEPHPRPLDLVFWDRVTGAVTHQAVPFIWNVEVRNMPLTWSNDSQTLFFNEDVALSSGDSRIMQLKPGSDPTPLLTHPGFHGGVDFEGPDGSLYYSINHGGGQFGFETYRLEPAGHSELLFDNTHSRQIAYGVTFTDVEGTLTVIDHIAKTTQQYQVPADQVQARSYGWPYPNVPYGPQWQPAYVGPALRIVPTP